MHLFRESVSMRNVAFQIGIACGLVVAATVAADAQGGRVGVAVTGLRSDSGVVRCGLYANANGFAQPGHEMRGTVARISGHQATCVFSGVKPGRYAVAAFHAEQNESQLQYGAFGKPKQGYGFSGNASWPNFSSAAFDFQGGNQSMQVQLQY
jgi:uncharacterized protein (DUF2141 family)